MNTEKFVGTEEIDFRDSHSDHLQFFFWSFNTSVAITKLIFVCVTKVENKTGSRTFHQQFFFLEITVLCLREMNLVR